MKTNRVVRLLVCTLCMALALPAAFADEKGGSSPVLQAISAPILSADGIEYKDLNKNGALDPYEDWRLTPDERADDLLQQMTDSEKAAQMAHMTLVTLKESWFRDLDIGFALAYTYLAQDPQTAVERANHIQELCEESRLGIPAVLSMDSVIGASWVNGATILPDQITLAAAGDAEIVRQLAILQRDEMKALGLRMSLSPVADIATDPRWGRVQECFGEDADMAAKMVVAAIDGLQNGTDGLNEGSVIACVKHFPGSGAQTAGVDGSPLVYDDETFQMHLSVFKAAIAANAAAIMPYGYSTVPYLGGDAADNYAHESSTVMTKLLRGELGYTGIIQTDWGLNHVVAALAGADVLGGAGQRDVSKLADNLDTDTLNDRVKKILVAKFKLGIFENPYVDAETTALVVGCQAHYDAVLNAAQKAMTLVKYENQTPLAGQKLIVAGSLAADAEALSSGWKINADAGLDTTGKSILDALKLSAGEENVTYIEDDSSKVASNYPAGTTAIVVVGEKTGTHEPSWGTATLEFPREQLEMLEALKKAKVNVVTVVLMNRPYVMTEVSGLSDAVLLAYRPGVTAGAQAVADALFGRSPIAGKTPFQIPATMDQVLLQREDAAKDIQNPLYDDGFGLEIVSFGR